MRLTKHHGLGNDFLVLLDPDDRQPLTEELALALCHRRRGVGADGLIRFGSHCSMELRNADGGEAEMSGNGIRCLAQAVAMAEGVDHLDLDVATVVGPRRVAVHPGHHPRTHLVTTALGRPGAGPGVPDGVAGKAVGISMGNPHIVVLVDDLADVDVATDGARICAGVPGGANVEFVTPSGDGGGIDMRVWERGAGLTEACGTGAAAAAVAARDWGLSEGDVVVHQPGGDAIVDFVDDGVTLSGPIVYVAEVDVTWP